MKRILLILACVLFASGAVAKQPDWSRTVLNYDAPAQEWTHALPVGNGRLGAMVWGIPGQERLSLNEESLWSGGPYDPTVTGGAAALPQIRQYLFDGDVEKAHDLFGRTMMGQPYEQQKYQPLGTLWLDFPGHEEPDSYSRVLDMDAGEVRITYQVGGVTYTRTVFSSAPDQVMVVRIEANEPGAISFDAFLQGVRNPAHSNYGTDYFRMDGLAPDTLRITGKNSDYLGIEGRLRYEARLIALPEGGDVDVDYRTLKVQGANAVTLVFAAATSFVDYDDVSADPAVRVERVLAAVKGESYSSLRDRHREDHRNLFRRVWLEIGNHERDGMPIDRRLAQADSVSDPGLAALTYQFGRYLLISTSRPGTQAANLQGIWNDSPNPSWDSKYTININIPMNYWPAESAGLPELVGPLYDLIRDVSETGRSVAREHWGADGWVLHQNTDLWRATAPMDGPSWGAWPVGGAWLSTHLVERERFDPDPEFMASWYPILRDQTRFLADILVEHPEHGWLVTAPSNSPENFPAFPGNGRYFDETSGLFLRGRMMQPGPTMDNHIIRAVFEGFLDWAARMDADPEMRAEVRRKRDRLPPNQIGKHGQLQEWIEDWDELEQGHRHVSHLWGVYPGSEIYGGTIGDERVGGGPEGVDVLALANAAAKSLARRGTGGCGWSYAHKAGVWGRLHRGEMAGEQLSRYLADNVLPNLFSRCSRTLQVDGSFGMTAAIGEMLLQSDRGVIEILPALPGDWDHGQVTGLRARGGFVIDMAWDSGVPVAVTLSSKHGQEVRLKGMNVARVLAGRTEVALTRNGGEVRFETEEGHTYTMVPRR